MTYMDTAISKQIVLFWAPHFWVVVYLLDLLCDLLEEFSILACPFSEYLIGFGSKNQCDGVIYFATQGTRPPIYMDAK